MCVVALLTDLSTQATFVGMMNGVIKSLAPNVHVIDLTHHVPPKQTLTQAVLRDCGSSQFTAFPGTLSLPNKALNPYGITLICHFMPNCIAI